MIEFSKNIRLSILIIYPLLLLLVSSIGLMASEPLHASKGVIDLRGSSVLDKEAIKLRGEWEMYYGQLLHPDEIDSVGVLSGYLDLPGTWNGFKLNGEKLSGQGYLTLRLRILMDEDEERYSLKILDFCPASEVYFNGAKVYKNGVIEKDRKSSIPSFKPEIVNIRSTGAYNEVVVRLSNFHTHVSHIDDVYFGRRDKVLQLHLKKLFIDIFLFGAILIMGIYHLGLFEIRRKNYAALYFSFFCLLLAFRIMLIGDRFALSFFDIPFAWMIKAEFLAFYLGAASFMAYAHNIFPKSFSLWFLRPFVFASFILSLFVIIAPTFLFTATLNFFQALTAIGGLYVIYIAIRNLKRKDNEPLIFLVGFIILFITVINDILYFNEVIHLWESMSSAGLFIFIIFQAFLLSSQFTKAVNKQEKLAIRLKHINKNLSNIVKEKTLELNIQKDQISEKHDQLKVLIDTLPDLIYFKDTQARFITANMKTVKIMKAGTLEELVGKTDYEFYPFDMADKYMKDDLLVLEKGIAVINRKEQGWDEHGNPCFLLTNKMPLLNIEGKIYGMVGVGHDITRQTEYEEKLINQAEEQKQTNNMLEDRQAMILQQQEILTLQKDDLTKQKGLIEEKNKDITDSLNYASKIQNAVLPTDEQFKDCFYNHFIYYKPKDIVSGDFYWIKRIRNKIVVASADCTGHGVPGAFMSLLGIAFMNEIVNMMAIKGEFDENSLPEKILNELRKRIKSALKQTSSIDETFDGIDMALCIIDYAEGKLHYAGANSPVYFVKKKPGAPRFDDSQNYEENKVIVDENEHVTMLEVKANRMPIGAYLAEKSFTSFEIALDEVDYIYMFSDGYTDQIGGPTNTKFRLKRFKQLLLDHANKELDEQYLIIKNTMDEWMNKEIGQIDDITVIGVKVHANREERSFGLFDT